MMIHHMMLLKGEEGLLKPSEYRHKGERGWPNHHLDCKSTKWCVIWGRGWL